mmetsp:Transcript_31491/g.57717  ORF Transcript_31491/g.57717 Transcript_31491/m.57717 type:complete len:261 (-) Transcript_31491:55-837(-)
MTHLRGQFNKRTYAFESPLWLELCMKSFSFSGHPVSTMRAPFSRLLDQTCRAFCSSYISIPKSLKFSLGGGQTPSKSACSFFSQPRPGSLLVNVKMVVSSFVNLCRSAGTLSAFSQLSRTKLITCCVGRQMPTSLAQVPSLMHFAPSACGSPLTIKSSASLRCFFIFFILPLSSLAAPRICQVALPCAACKSKSDPTEALCRDTTCPSPLTSKPLESCPPISSSEPSGSLRADAGETAIKNTRSLHIIFRRKTSNNMKPR